MFPKSYRTRLFLASFVLGIYCPGNRASPIGPVVPSVSTCKSGSYDYTKGAVPEGPEQFVSSADPNAYTPGGKDPLRLKMSPLDGVKNNDGVNDKLAATASVNSTFIFQRKGTIKIDASLPQTPGIVSSIKLIGETTGAEIVLEVRGNEPNNWHTKLGSDEGNLLMPANSTIASRNVYSIEYNQDKVVWHVEREGGEGVKKELTREELEKGGGKYPADAMRVQFRVWDASYDKQLASDTGGPVNWDNARDHPPIMAVYKVDVNC